MSATNVGREDALAHKSRRSPERASSEGASAPDREADKYADWTALPRSASKTGATVKPLGAVKGGLIVLLDAHGLAAAGLSLGKVSARLSPDGGKLVVSNRGNTSNLSHPKQGEMREGYVARLVIPGPRAPFTEPHDLELSLDEDGAAVLALPAGKAVVV